MSEAPELPAHTVQLIERTGDQDADSTLYLVAANSADGELRTEVIDVRTEAPDAFPPRTVAARVVTDTASFLAEIKRRPLVDNYSTVWGNRKAGEVTVVYDELGTTDDVYTRRADRLTLKFIADPDWATLLKAADSDFHGQEEFGNLIESAGHLITSHPAAEIMEIVDSVRASSSGSFESRIRRDTGAQHLTFTEQVNTTAGSSSKPLEVPREITLTARPFEDYPQIDVACWLRLRISQGKLFLGLFPKPYQHLVRAAWVKVTGDLAEALDVPVYAANL